MRNAALALAAAVTAAAALTAALVTGPGPDAGTAADHLDAPGLTPPGGNSALDITDLYAFRAQNGKTVLVLNVNGLTKKGEHALFASGAPGVARTKAVAYWLRVDNDGDAVADVDYQVRFGKANARGVQSLTLLRNGKSVVQGRTSAFGETRVNRSKGYRVYAGMRDDPFFFDLQGFLNILSQKQGESFLGCTGKRPDQFAGTNVSSIVVEAPAGELTAGTSTIGVWAATTMGAKQVDRKGRPAIATVFIPNNPFPGEQKGQEASLKNAYNRSQPKDDRRRWRGEVVDTLTVLHSLNDANEDKSDDAKKIDGLADVLLPDVLTFDTASAKGFLNGRRPADDVIDAELALVTEGAATTDCVSENDRPFPAAFPYLAAPHG
jgi:hypothetical protein